MALPEHLQGFLKYPRESIKCELKPWLDPKTHEYDQAIIAKACMALRNVNGGVLLIGIRDNGTPSKKPVNSIASEIFTPDCIHSILHKFSAEKFEVEIFHNANSSVPCVVLNVPGGLTTPVLCKNSFCQKRVKLQKGTIYTRTYRASNVISTAPANQADLTEIVKICHDNRSADMGEFLRRHLTDENVEVLARRIEPLRAPGPLTGFADDSSQRRQKLFTPNNAGTRTGWFEVAFQVPGDLAHIDPNQRWIGQLLQTNPELTGWPLFVALWRAEKDVQPRMATQTIWEWQDEPGDYWQIDGRKGLFYATRAYLDDTSSSCPAPGKVLDFFYQIRNVAESIAIASKFANWLCGDDPHSGESIDMLFRWTGLEQRQLSNWIYPSYLLRFPEENPMVSTAEARLVIPMAMSDDEVAIYSTQAVNEMLRCFDGREIAQATVSSIVGKLMRSQLL